MKNKLNLLLAGLLSAYAAVAQPAKPAHAENKSDVILVVAQNPTFGSIAASTLAAAEIEAAALTELDPVCQAIPQICSARYSMTTFIVIYSDGQVNIIN